MPAKPRIIMAHVEGSGTAAAISTKIVTGLEYVAPGVTPTSAAVQMATPVQVTGATEANEKPALKLPFAYTVSVKVLLPFIRFSVIVVLGSRNE
jgi:hypothetical protein